MHNPAAWCKTHRNPIDGDHHMTPLETLAAAIGFTPPEGEALTVEMVLDAVMEFIDADEGDAQSMAAAVATGERPSLRDIHSMVADVHAAERDRPASAEALANIDALSATATQLAERVAVADRFESIAEDRKSVV